MSLTYTGWKYQVGLGSISTSLSPPPTHHCATSATSDTCDTGAGGDSRTTAWHTGMGLFIQQNLHATFNLFFHSIEN